MRCLWFEEKDFQVKNYDKELWKEVIFNRDGGQGVMWYSFDFEKSSGYEDILKIQISRRLWILLVLKDI